MDLWIFAVNNKFPELAEYSLTSTAVKREITNNIRNSERGLRWFLEDRGIPLSMLQRIVAAMASSSSWETTRVTI
jgi:hypothetical protein